MKLVTGAVAVAVGFFGAGQASADVVKVGLIASFTGAFATWGTQFQQAVEAYQAVHGKTVKGPDGKQHEIQFIYRDAASAGPDKAKQLAEELVLREKVKFLTGLELSPLRHGGGRDLHAGQDSGRHHERGDRVDHARLALLRAGEHDDPAARRAARAVGRPRTASRTVYTIVSDYAPGHDAETYFTKAFKAGGGEIVGSARSPQQETNYRRLHGEGAAGQARRALHVPAGRLALDRVRQGLCRARPQGRRHQAARHRRDAGTVPAAISPTT